jgi:hypothetical protein
MEDFFNLIKCQITMSMEPSAWEYNWDTLFLGDMNKGTWPSRLGRLSDETVKYGYGLCATWPIE